MDAEPGKDAARYNAPALEKGLDIIELLAGTADALSQQEIASRLGRSVSEIFRMLVALERRGYIRRRERSGSYALTLRLFELAQHHAPVRRLLTEAGGEMQALAARIGQSCHISMAEADSIVVIAQAESGRSRNFLVKVGARFPMRETASGRVLAAFRAEGGEGPALARIRARGWEEAPSDIVQGVTDLSFPVSDATGHAIAAITVPFLEMADNPVSLADARGELAAVAARLSQALGAGPPIITDSAAADRPGR